MVTLVKQELFKLVHKKSTWITSVMMLIIMTIYAFIARNNANTFDPKAIYIGLFTGMTWVVFFMIAASSSIISMEFQYGTIKELLYRKYYRGEILVSKWITMFLYSVYFMLLAFVYALILKVTVLNSNFQLSENYGYKHSILTTTIYTSLAQFVSLWLILSLVLLLANLFKSSAAAISVGIIGYFAISIISSLLAIVIKKWTWLKWNPLNMMNYPNQVASPSLKHITLLSTNELLIGSLVYMAIFLGISYVVFKRRSV